jgi:hypothetical protein
MNPKIKNIVIKIKSHLSNSSEIFYQFQLKIIEVEFNAVFLRNFFTN